MSRSRRRFLASGLLAGSAFLSANMLLSLAARGATRHPGQLRPSTVPGLLLPEGFHGRVVARSGAAPLPGKDFAWHYAPDGGACFADGDGWIYVSNSEQRAGFGGASALRFGADGELLDAYSILSGTERNCAGGATPWGTWLSCEEPFYGLEGQVFECDPRGVAAAVPRPALGLFCHEAAAVDPVHGHVYLTEDVPDGGLYRFASASRDGPRLDLDKGELQVACWRDTARTHLDWAPVPDPYATRVPTRDQVRGMARFAGGEGCAWHQGKVFFTTKHDNRLWRLDTASNHLEILYDDDNFSEPLLRGVDNVTVSCSGEVLVAEDGDNMQIVLVSPEGKVRPLLQILDHPRSEIAGPAFNPAGDRLYFSSQWGESGSLDGRDGVTYEVSGPFFC